MAFRVKQRVKHRVMPQVTAAEPGENQTAIELDENFTSLVVPPDWSGHVSVNRKVGQGSFGKVFDMTITCSDTHVAVKVMHKLAGAAEARLLEQLSSGRVLKVLEHGLSYDDNWKKGWEWGYYIMTEFADGGDLAGLIASDDQSVSFQKKIELVAEILEGLAFLHGKDVIHNDIKPNNILLFNGAGGLQAKLADLGLSCALSGQNEGITSCQRMGTKNVGAPPYQSPEHMITNTVDLPKDMWAVGILVYELVFGYGGRRPSAYAMEGVLYALHYKNESLEALEANATVGGKGWAIQDGELKFDFSILSSSAAPLEYRRQLQTLLQGLMNFDPVKRLTAQQALDLCMQMLDKPLPSAKVLDAPPCWKDRAITKEAQLVTSTEKAYPISEEQVSNVDVNARGAALRNAVALGHVESVKLLLDHEISDDAMADVVEFALGFAVDRGAQYIDDILPALRVHMTASMIDKNLVENIKRHVPRAHLTETVEWLLETSLVSGAAKVQGLKDAAHWNLEATACVLVESMEEAQLPELFNLVQRAVGQGLAGIVNCLLTRIGRSTDPTITERLQEAINKQAITASKKGRISLASTVAKSNYLAADRFATFEMLVDLGISDDVASDILLWYVCQDDLAKFDARFISKSVDRLAGKTQFLTKALSGANELGHTDLGKQLIDAGAVPASEAKKVCEKKPERVQVRPRVVFPKKE